MFPAHCLSLGRGGARPGGCERGGYSPIPRRDARVGEWGAGDASAEGRTLNFLAQSEEHNTVRCLISKEIDY